MNARVIEFRATQTTRRCPWCDERLEATDDKDAIRKFDRSHQKCRDKVRFGEHGPRRRDRFGEVAQPIVASPAPGVRR